MVAVSVDEPSVSEALRQEHQLPFRILCDTKREMLPTWDLLNKWELGGIARPAAFVIDENLQVTFGLVGDASHRVLADDIVEMRKSGAHPQLSSLKQQK